MMSDRTREIAVLAWIGQDYGRRVARGVAEFAQQGLPLRVSVIQPNVEQKFERLQNDLDGLVLAVEPYEGVRLRYASGLPQVDASRFARSDDAASVSPDWRAVGRAAAEHLLSQGLQHITFCCLPEQAIEQQLAGGMAEVLEPCGQVMAEPLMGSHAEGQQAAAWLRSLPKPVGILVEKDTRGRALLVAAREAGFEVPADVAILGVGNEELLCLNARPALSSIAMPAEQIGYRAAEMLWGLLNGQEAKSLRLRPGRVVQRGSTEALAGKNTLVAQAIRVIRERFAAGIDAQDVARHVGVHRRTLHRHFLNATGRSVHDELVRCRIERACELLADTHWPVKTIAFEVGWRSAEHFGRFFRRHAGLLPSAYRRKYGQHTT